MPVSNPGKSASAPYLALTSNVYYCFPGDIQRIAFFFI